MEIILRGHPHRYTISGCSAVRRANMEGVFHGVKWVNKVCSSETGQMAKQLGKFAIWLSLNQQWLI